MKKYYRFIIETVIVFAALTYYTFKEVIPEYKNSIGSSERFLVNGNYANYVEIKIDNDTDFAFLVNDKGNVFHMFFFDNNASSLYNKNIENNSIDVALKIVFEVLGNKGYYNKNSSISIYHTSNKYLKEISKIISSYSTNIKDYNIDLKEKALEYSIEADSDYKILFALDIYSKELASDKNGGAYNNNKWVLYADQIYDKIDFYIKDKGITNMRKEDVNYPLSLIPDDSKTYYPTTNSWYYVKDGKVYAFIELENNNSLYRYCYYGSIDNKTKGVCD